MGPDSVNSASQTITMSVAEKARLQRAAFTDGAAAMYIQPEVPGGLATSAAYKAVCKKAAERYPLPKVTRSREVEFDGLRYRSNTATDELEYYCHFQRRWVVVAKAVSYARMVQDLTNNPTEEVDA